VGGETDLSEKREGGITMKKLIAVSAAAFALALPAAASAEGPADWASGPSQGGAQATEAAGAQCGSGAVSGSFGYFGEHGQVHDFGINNLGTDGRPGANGRQTGLSNSAVCGNRS
jgi:hypothetical protein